MSKVKCIGIIAEDNSDFETVRTLIKRIINKDKLPFKKAIGNGCGKMKRKALDYAKDLTNRGCNLIILFHDLDRNQLSTLRDELTATLQNLNSVDKFICIPVEELEAWFLSDPQGIKRAMNLKRTPNINRKPENIPSPKEYLRDCINIYSDKEKIYINTKHNE